jgi:hypothetical protein
VPSRHVIVRQPRFDSVFASSEAFIGSGTVPAFGFVAITGIHQFDAAWQAQFARPFDLPQRHFGLGGEFNNCGNAGFLSPFRVAGPFLRKVKLISDRKAGVMIGMRQRHRDLAIRLFANLAAILMRNPNGMLPVFGKSGIVDNPSALCSAGGVWAKFFDTGSEA